MGARHRKVAAVGVHLHVARAPAPRREVAVEQNMHPGLRRTDLRVGIGVVDEDLRVGVNAPTVWVSTCVNIDPGQRLVGGRAEHDADPVGVPGLVGCKGDGERRPCAGIIDRGMIGRSVGDVRHLRVAPVTRLVSPHDGTSRRSALDQQRGAVLQLTESTRVRGLHRDLREYDTIFGRTTKGKDVTLYIRHRPGEAFCRWLVNVRDLIPIRALFFLALYGDNFLEGRFLSLGIARGTSPGGSHTKDETGGVNGWTPERRAQQSRAIRRWRPWDQSTGPRTAQGKMRSARNAFKGARWRQERELFKVFTQVLRAHRKTLRRR